MRESGWYAPGTEFRDDAPWNQKDIPEKDFDITCSQSLSRTATVTTNNYIPGASGVDYEPDIDGSYSACEWHDDDDTSDTDWNKEYGENNHLTPLQLIQLFKIYLEKHGDTITCGDKQAMKRIKHLIEECEGWSDDETEYILES